MIGIKRSLALLVATMLMVSSIQPLTAQSNSRSASIRAAQSRASRIAPLPSNNHWAGQRMAYVQDTPQPSAPIVGSPNSGVVGSDPIVGGGSPIVSDGYFSEAPQSGVYQGVAGSCMTGGCNRGCGPGGCGTGACGPGVYGDACGPGPVACGYPMCNPCCYPWGQCLFRGLGMLWRNTEIIGGAQGFRSRSFFAGDQLIDDSSFGFYGGANTIVPLRRLTCGLFSGQIGVRSVQSEFDGDVYSSDHRDQLFVTAALFRQVDCGLQFGVAFDYLEERWFSNAELAQVRGDVGWAWPGGCVFGFRFATGTEDDVTDGVVNNVPFNNQLVDVIDNYRFYYRMPAINSGFFDVFAGWSEDSDAIFGMDFDLPITRCCAMQSGFTYFLPEDLDDTTATIVQRDAWNVFVGVAFRPQGGCWYRNCDRPMFNVADNGSFVLRRQ